MKHWHQPHLWSMWQGYVWSAGHAVAYRDGDKSGKEAPAVSVLLDREDKATAAPVSVASELHGYLVMTDETMVCAHFIRRAEILFPGVGWTHGEPLDPLIGRVGGDLVAIVMPVRMGTDEAAKNPGHPKCPTCGGDGKKEDCANCEGSGETECPHCDNETTCKACDGKGRMGTCADCGGDGRWRE